MSEKKKYTIVIRYFNAETKELEVTAKLKTIALTRERAAELAKIELHKATTPGCWEIK
jgi:predicted transcriptional regulator